MIDELDGELLLQSVEEPNDSGALGRNKNGYFHVRFQLSMTKLTDVAITTQRTDALQAFANNLAYSFNYQEADGGFQLIPPQSLIDDPNIPLANAGDRVSAVAFFAYSLGLSLTSLENSDWYQNSAEITSLRQQIQAFEPQIATTLAYLKSNTELLSMTDQVAPNRLLFDAVAFYSLGTYLQDEEAKAIGVSYIESALELVDQSACYFIEGGGWDSSYNGVALKVGLEMYSLLSDSEIKTELGQALVCAMDWQLSRILPGGEISTEGNARVFPGGEAFLGNEKTVDVEKSVYALLYFASLTNDQSYHELALEVLDFYQ